MAVIKLSFRRVDDTRALASLSFQISLRSIIKVCEEDTSITASRTKALEMTHVERGSHSPGPKQELKLFLPVRSEETLSPELADMRTKVSCR